MSAPFTSYAQNGEDVVLWRALGHVEDGYYVDIGANDPVDDSVTKAFYDRGWTGLNVDAAPEFVERLRSLRPDDVTVDAAVATVDRGSATFHDVPGTGLSSLDDAAARSAEDRGYTSRDLTVTTRRLDSLVAEHAGDRDVHFCKIDVEGGEAGVLESVDLAVWRPWVLVVEATAPHSSTPRHEEWEPGVLAAGYRLCLFDGVSRFYVADEHADSLGPQLSYPACILDDYVTFSNLRMLRSLQSLQEAHDRAAGQLRDQQELRTEINELRHDLRAWRRRALESWADVVADRSPTMTRDARAYAEELDAIRHTLSWRITRPLRSVRSRFGGSP